MTYRAGKEDVISRKKKGGENVGVGVNCVCVRVYHAVSNESA